MQYYYGRESLAITKYQKCEIIYQKVGHTVAVAIYMYMASIRQEVRQGYCICI